MIIINIRTLKLFSVYAEELYVICIDRMIFWFLSWWNFYSFNL